MIVCKLLRRRFYRHKYALQVILSVLLLLCLHDESCPQHKELVVATKETPPFSMKTPDGAWSGISIALWREIAGELNLEFRFVETDLQGMLDGLKEGRFDAAVAALTITKEREKAFDFTHPFYITGLGIAIKQEQRSWVPVVRRFFSAAFLKVIFLLTAILLIFGLILWLLEKKRNPEQFSSSVKGIGEGFWWAAVTMTTVGYGDKAPKTIAGRIIATIWMFTAIIIISGFTASITSSLTVSQLGSVIKGPEDLPGHRVASIEGSTSERYLSSQRIASFNYATVEEGLRAVEKGEVDCMVYDAPVLKYHILKGKYHLSVVKRVFEQQLYAFGLVQDSLLREQVNRLLLEKTGLPWWKDTVYTYLGE
jgi:ABC-type amino acid transport substrate-binding protein